MKTKNFLFVILILSIVWAAPASAGQVDAASVSQTLISKMAVVSAALSSKAIIALGLFATLQMVITNFGLFKSGADIEAVFGKMIGSLAWIGFCVYVLQNGPAFISDVGNAFFAIPGLELPTVGAIMKNTAEVAAVIGALAWPVGVASNTLGSLLIYLLLIVLAVGCFFAFKIFMLQLELGLVVMLSPLSFSFLGLNALKDQGIAPFKSLISLVYRIILIGVILSGFTVVDDAIKAAFSNLSLSDFVSGLGNIISTICAAFGAYLLLAYLVYKSDSIAASLAGGSTSMGTGDVASAAAMGAAAGAAVASGGTSLAGAAAKAPQSMGDYLKGLANQSGSVSNASSRGAGPTPVGTAPSSPASLSKANTTAGGGNADSQKNKYAAEAAAEAMRASSGAQEAGASPAAASAAENAVSAGQNSAEISQAVQDAGGTPEQGVAAAMSAKGAAQQHIKAATDAMASGKTPKEVGFAVAEAGGSYGVFSAAHQAAAASTSDTSGAKAGIGTDQQLNAQQQPATGSGKKSWLDDLSNVNQHIAREGTATTVSINTHHSD